MKIRKIGLDVIAYHVKQRCWQKIILAHMVVFIVIGKNQVSEKDDL